MGYAPFEVELAAIEYLCSKEEFYLRRAKVVHIFFDTKNMGTFFKSDLMSVNNSGFQDDEEKLLPFNLEAEYLQGAQLQIADYGSMTDREHKEFRTSRRTIGVKIKSRRDIRDPSLDKLAVLAKEDPEY